jgi:tetratricopeptide repeat protein
MSSFIQADEYRNIKRILEDEGYFSKNNFDLQLRYGLLKEPELTLIFGFKIPINIPILRKPPIELVTFHVSMGIRPRRADQNFETTVRQIAVSLKEMILKLELYAHDFNFDRYKDQILTQIEKYYPNQEDSAKKTFNNENMLYSYVRDKILRDNSDVKLNNSLISQDVLDIAKDFHLRPTDELPPELSQGLSRARKNLVVFMKHENPNEFLIEEPGSFTYWRDYHHNGVWIRTAVECHTANIWYQAFRDQKFRMNYLFYDWLVYCRGLVHPIIDLIDTPQFNNQSLKSFSEIAFLQENLDKKEIPGLFLPRLAFESRNEVENHQRETNLFESPPSSLEEMSTINDYSQANFLIRKENYPAAQKLLYNAKIKLQKFHHLKGQIKIIFRLYELAKLQKRYEDSIKILEEAIELAKTGKIPIPDIVNIHLSLIYSYAMGGNKDMSEKHLGILLKFLRLLPTDDKSDNLLLKSHLKMAILRMDQEKFSLANEHFKYIHSNYNKNPIYEFLYYYWRAHFYRLTKKESKQQLSLEKAISIKEGPIKEIILAHFELGKYFLYTKNEPEKSIDYILETDKMINTVDIASMRIKVKCYEMLADAYRGLENSEEAQRAVEESEKLRERLDRLSI